MPMLTNIEERQLQGTDREHGKRQQRQEKELEQTCT